MLSLRNSFVLTAFVSALLAASACPQTQPAPTPPIEVRLNGPHLIRRGDHLKFAITITNRTDAPVALRFPRIDGDKTTQFIWRVTDAGGRLLPPHFYEGPIQVYCPVTSGPSDWDIVVLALHETMNYDYCCDPTDDFAFPQKGFYRISLTYILDPDPKLVEAPYQVPTVGKPETYTPQQKIASRTSVGKHSINSRQLSAMRHPSFSSNWYINCQPPTRLSSAGAGRGSPCCSSASPNCSASDASLVWCANASGDRNTSAMRSSPVNSAIAWPSAPGESPLFMNSRCVIIRGPTL